MITSAEELYWRQLDVFDPRKYDVPVTLIGCGGIGSAVGLVLAKMGIKQLELWDGDTVEYHNLPNQLYPAVYHNTYEMVDTIGQHKSFIMEDFMRHMAPDMSVHVHTSMWDGEPLSGIVVCGVDSMKVRQAVWDSIQANPMLCKLYIDGRMGAESGMVYALQPTDAPAVASYAKTLYSDAEASEAPCTERAIMYNVFVLAGIVGKQVRAFLTGSDMPFGMVFDLNALGFMKLEVKR